MAGTLACFAGVVDVGLVLRDGRGGGWASDCSDGAWGVRTGTENGNGNGKSRTDHTYCCY